MPALCPLDRVRADALTGRRPLCMPEELWDNLTAEHQEIFVHAQAVLYCLEHAGPLELAETCRQVGVSLQQLAGALKLLKMIGLIQLGSGSTVQLIALPAEPVRVRRPDGSRRWILVTRRVGASPRDLN